MNTLDRVRRGLVLGIGSSSVMLGSYCDVVLVEVDGELACLVGCDCGECARCSSRWRRSMMLESMEGVDCGLVLTGWGWSWCRYGLTLWVVVVCGKLLSLLCDVVDLCLKVSEYV